MKKGKFINLKVLDYLVIVCILSILAFTGVSMIFYYKNGVPPPLELTGYFFAFFGGELLAMATITITKKFAEKGRLKKPSEILEEISQEDERC